MKRTNGETAAFWVVLLEAREMLAGVRRGKTDSLRRVALWRNCSAGECGEISLAHRIGNHQPLVRLGGEKKRA